MDLEITDLTKLSDNICLSGGADGSDLQWGMMAGKSGHSVIHWSFKGHKSNAPENETVRLTNEQLLRADEYLKRANISMKRRWPTSNEFANNLLRRNWYQVSESQAVYAVATLSSSKQVSGGTAWATSMYMDRFIYDNENIETCRLYLYDQNTKKWWLWRNEWVELSGDPSKPSGVWTGIGSRDLTVDGKNAIRRLMT